MWKYEYDYGKKVRNVRRIHSAWCYLANWFNQVVDIRHQTDHPLKMPYFHGCREIWSYRSFTEWLLQCNGYCRRKWTRKAEFQSWTKLFAFHIAFLSRKGMYTFILSCNEKIVGQTEHFNLTMPTDQGEGKLNSNRFWFLKNWLGYILIVAEGLGTCIHHILYIDKPTVGKVGQYRRRKRVDSKTFCSSEESNANHSIE